MDTEKLRGAELGDVDSRRFPRSESEHFRAFILKYNIDGN